MHDDTTPDDSTPHDKTGRTAFLARGRPANPTHTVLPAAALALGLGLATLSVLTGLPGSGLAQRGPPRAAARAAVAVAAIELAPHRAVYEFALGTARSSNSVASVAGRMVYEFTGSVCEGYTQSMRFVTRTSSQEGEVTVNDQRTSSWEDAAGTRYRFQSSQFRGDQLSEQTAGTAARGEADADMAVELTHPEKTKTAVGNRALYPVQHSVKLLEAARRGETSFKAEFFDGSEGGEKSYIINAHIGRPVAAAYNKSLPRVGQAERLDGIAAWPVALSYFEHGSEKRDAVPNYEMSFLIFQNGVSRRLVIDNGEYTMKGELTELVMLDPVPCKK